MISTGAVEDRYGYPFPTGSQRGQRVIATRHSSHLTQLQRLGIAVVGERGTEVEKPPGYL